MKGQVNDGGPAFPCEEWVEEKMICHPGLSLRAYAALAVLPSVINGSASHGTYLRTENDAARIALDYADALLEALDA